MYIANGRGLIFGGGVERFCAELAGLGWCIKEKGPAIVYHKGLLKSCNLNPNLCAGKITVVVQRCTAFARGDSDTAQAAGLDE
ncbi:hypothetical protein [Chryseolinea lacunae]|uniref:Uncharacterized protein n=1 Tax=Chryseolinea lacunae TaxID=2801331 RepID=A0ABS1KYM2_9BACT|nr:hypothetical protein [Chryseolinea lacunae]MBL0744554.1 hypothetical protein [Chryseolinea lacunae]